MSDTLAMQLDMALILSLAACLCAYITMWTDLSERAAMRWVISWVLVLSAFGGWLLAFDLAYSCDWDYILEMWGWCTPCAYYYWFQSGCA